MPLKPMPKRGDYCAVLTTDHGLARAVYTIRRVLRTNAVGTIKNVGLERNWPESATAANAVHGRNSSAFVSIVYTLKKYGLARNPALAKFANGDGYGQEPGEFHSQDELQKALLDMIGSG